MAAVAKSGFRLWQVIHGAPPLSPSSDTASAEASPKLSDEEAATAVVKLLRRAATPRSDNVDTSAFGGALSKRVAGKLAAIADSTRRRRLADAYHLHTQEKFISALERGQVTFGDSDGAAETGVGPSVATTAELAQVRLLMQGDRSMYTQEMLAARAALRVSEATRRMLFSMWVGSPKALADGVSTPAPPTTATNAHDRLVYANQFVMTRPAYDAVAAALFRRLVPGGTAAELLASLDDDWASEAGGAAAMTFELFSEAMFTTVDLWCLTTDPAEYDDFFRQVMLPAAASVVGIDPHRPVDVAAILAGRPAQRELKAEPPSAKPPAAPPQPQPKHGGGKAQAPGRRKSQVTGAGTPRQGPSAAPSRAAGGKAPPHGGTGKGAAKAAAETVKSQLPKPLPLRQDSPKPQRRRSRAHESSPSPPQFESALPPPASVPVSPDPEAAPESASVSPIQLSPLPQPLGPPGLGGAVAEGGSPGADPGLPAAAPPDADDAASTPPEISVPWDASPDRLGAIRFRRADRRKELAEGVGTRAEQTPLQRAALQRRKKSNDTRPSSHASPAPQGGGARTSPHRKPRPLKGSTAAYTGAAAAPAGDRLGLTGAVRLGRLVASDAVALRRGHPRAHSVPLYAHDFGDATSANEATDAWSPAATATALPAVRGAAPRDARNAIARVLLTTHNGVFAHATGSLPSVQRLGFH